MEATGTNEVQINEAAKRCGVTPRTFKRWIASLGYVMPRRLGRGRYIVTVPENLIDEFREQHSIRIPHVRGVSYVRQAY